jgi:hypothetical protein
MFKAKLYLIVTIIIIIIIREEVSKKRITRTVTKTRIIQKGNRRKEKRINAAGKGE